MKHTLQGIALLVFLCVSLYAIGATQVLGPVSEVFLERLIIVDRGQQLAATSEVLTFTSMQNCINWKARNASQDFGTDRPTHEGTVFVVSVTSECAAK